MRNILLFALAVVVLLAAAVLFKKSRDEPEPVPMATQPDIKKVEQPKAGSKTASVDIVEAKLVEKLLFSPEPVMLAPGDFEFPASAITPSFSAS